jgi:hypothetical protein
VVLLADTVQGGLVDMVESKIQVRSIGAMPHLVVGQAGQVDPVVQVGQVGQAVPVERVAREAQVLQVVRRSVPRGLLRGRCST